tara:strand:+ start:973 stop:1281 length:309 start_codon:yes stop_codon:yes gene_type:complete
MIVRKVIDPYIAYLEEKRNHLMARRESKLEILREGGERALLHSRHDITRIDFALLRIDKKQYGLCPDCGCEIEEARLTSVPETVFCASCQSDRDKKNKHFRH